MIKNVYIRTRPGPGADDAITDSLLIDVGDAIRANGQYVIMRKDEINDETLVLALGGDGTMLSAVHVAADKGAYVTGFNYGHLGYLVPMSAKSIRGLTTQLRTLINDTNCLNDSDSSYKVSSYRLPTLKWKKHLAINDFYFVPAANGTAADFKIAVGSDRSFFETKSSGIVISTPFGSTGLSLSAGGPIVSPNSRVLIVAPMMPHTLTSRPIVFPDSDNVTVSWERKVNVFSDGRLIDGFGEGQVEISCKKRKINIIQPEQWDFFENLKNKMNWHT